MLPELKSEYFDIASFSVYSLASYPNFLVLGQPAYDGKHIFFEECKYLKIYLTNMLAWIKTLMKYYKQKLQEPYSVNTVEVVYLFETQPDTFFLNISANSNHEILFNVILKPEEVYELLKTISLVIFPSFCFTENVTLCIQEVFFHYCSFPANDYENTIKEFKKCSRKQLLLILRKITEHYEIHTSVVNMLNVFERTKPIILLLLRVVYDDLQ